jgi:hypothetical protein
MIKVNVEKTFSLDEAAHALYYHKDIHRRGKDSISNTIGKEWSMINKTSSAIQS